MQELAITKIEQNIGIFGEETCNRNGSYLIDFVLYNQLKVMNSFFDHKDSHKFTWEARSLKSIIDYGICSYKLVELVLDTRVSDHQLLICPVRMIPRWYKRKQKPIHNNNKLSYKVHLLNDSSIKWLYKKRLDELHTATDISEDVESEWINITNIIKQTTFENLGTKKKWLRKKGLRNWDDNIEKNY